MTRVFVTNATVRDTGERVYAGWVEDDESSEYARTYECVFSDGSVLYLAPEEVAIDAVPPSEALPE